MSTVAFHTAPVRVRQSWERYPADPTSVEEIIAVMEPPPIDVDTAALVSGAEPCHTCAARFSATALAAGTNAGA
jgi:hypothetical protein